MGNKCDTFGQWLKWSATLTLIIAAFLTANDIAYSKHIYLLANVLWFTVGMRWKEPSLWIASATMTGFYIVGLIR